jgi:hypothetical protein
MRIEDLRGNAISGEAELALDEIYKTDMIQEYSFNCPNCDNSIDKRTTGEYYPKSHLCHECMSWLWVWPNGGRSLSDDLVVKSI